MASPARSPTEDRNRRPETGTPYLIQETTAVKTSKMPVGLVERVPPVAEQSTLRGAAEDPSTPTI